MIDPVLWFLPGTNTCTNSSESTPSFNYMSLSYRTFVFTTCRYNGPLKSWFYLLVNRSRWEAMIDVSSRQSFSASAISATLGRCSVSPPCTLGFCFTATGGSWSLALNFEWIDPVTTSFWPTGVCRKTARRGKLTSEMNCYCIPCVFRDCRELMSWWRVGPYGKTFHLCCRTAGCKGSSHRHKYINTCACWQMQRSVIVVWIGGGYFIDVVLRVATRLYFLDVSTTACS